MHNDIIFSIFLIFSGAAVLATLSLYTRQSLLVAYIILGVVLGPFGLKLIDDPKVLKEIGDIGIIFLLFLLGLHLEPHNLLKTLKQTTIITMMSAFAFAAIGYALAIAGGFTQADAFVVGACMMFSSTIIALKLLPTTVLHHQRTGEIVISILLMQDIIAIFTLLILHGASSGTLGWFALLRAFIALPLLIIFAFLVERYLLIKIVHRFSRIHEYLFLVAIGWCLGLGQLAEMMNLSFEIGAFVAGISIAQSPIARFIAESLRPIRDFFLILFFFSLGAKIHLSLIDQIWLPAIALAALMLVTKPVIFQQLLGRIAPSKSAGWEIGVRLGQISEFSLLVAYTAENNKLISEAAYALIQITTVITFMVSSYWVVNRYPNPIAFSEKLRRD
ncbi:cation:proton antiporter domain-containing protein [Candidatus Berkiella aquae]|uniref:Cation:proton antiporter n=1 Tax=Candidatus Berkiella aquae TaxID=295108 RepID=A0A0Q9YKW1_9GAMM|nr:cation:proton antiporter [Candidatus Berkiella aquae]MCS5710902.1 cation:proton antiporter [Candidatus Berkiella aquae]